MFGSKLKEKIARKLNVKFKFIRKETNKNRAWPSLGGLCFILFKINTYNPQLSKLNQRCVKARDRTNTLGFHK